jgi:hypothetical protein
MNSSNYAIQIIPDLTIDDKYAAVIGDTQTRVDSFTTKAVKDGRIHELFVLEKSKLDSPTAIKILEADGRLSVGFQFVARVDAAAQNFKLYVKKTIGEGKIVKFTLTPAVQEIVLQLISLEDRRTVAVFSMLNSSMDVGYRILTTLYGNQLRRLAGRVTLLLQEEVTAKVERLAVSKSLGDEELWNAPGYLAHPTSGPAEREQRVSQDNILQVLVDDGTAAEINEYVSRLISGSERIQKKRMMLQENPDMPRSEIYEQMIREDLDHLENCYARVHIYLKAFYKNKDRRTVGQNRVLRQFFADQIEKILGETGLLEDLLSLNEEEYFKNIAREAP